MFVNEKICGTLYFTDTLGGNREQFWEKSADGC